MLPRELYNPANKAGMQQRYEDISLALVYAHRALADSLIAELTQNVDAYNRSQATSISAQDREASIASYTAKIEVYKQRGEVAALECERELVLQLLGSRS